MSLCPKCGISEVNSVFTICKICAEESSFISFKPSGPLTIQVNNPLSRRDYFAAAAMQGVFTKFFATNETYDIFAKHAVEIADALINELDRETK